MNEFSTPMMKQYEKIKQQYHDCLLFYRLGDFYELFMEDAHIGAKVLDLTLTGRPRGKDGRIPMAGVPFHAVDSYLAKLVKAGYKVALCEQVSEPDKQGIVEREVVRIVTPGTVLDEKSLDRKENNYIIAIHYDNTVLALSCADISTGQFYASQFPVENYSFTLINELSRLNASECILPKNLYDNPQLLKLIKTIQGINIFCFHDWEKYATNAEKTVKEHFKIKSLAPFGIEAQAGTQLVSAVLLGYLKETQKDKIDHFKSISPLVTDQHILLDRSTITNLELFTTLRDGDKRGSLLAVIDHTSTAMGARMLKRWLRSPLTERTLIEERHDAVDILRSNPETVQKISDKLENISDIERTLARISVDIGNARDMVSLKDTLQHILNIKELLPSLAASTLIHTIQNAITDEMTKIISLIDDTIADEPRFDPKEGGIIKDGVSKEIDHLRSILTHGTDWITQLEKQERERTGISSLKVRYNKVFGFYIEISNANLNAVPKEYTRKQTLVNGERFITPELKKQEEVILTAQEKVAELEYFLYRNVRDEILCAMSILQNVATHIAMLDCVCSFATLAEQNNYVRAQINNTGDIQILDGRHPVVEQFLEGRQFVPNNVTLNNGDHQLWLITGPNMAGKSVFIRQTALIVLLNQIGSFVPARSANVTIVDKIFVRSGASDVISEGLSTFMVEMIETAQIVHQATEKSLIVMDEIGRGTSTYDGISIAWAVAEYLVTNKKCAAKTLFATHYHELQALEQKHPNHIKNYHMAVHEQNGELNFLHTMQSGGASHSFGVAVAKLAGIPEQIITNAKSMLQVLEGRDQQHVAQSPKKTAQSQLTLAFDDTEKMVTKELQELDIHQMTPLQALNKIAELKTKIKLLQASSESFFKAG